MDEIVCFLWKWVFLLFFSLSENTPKPIKFISYVIGFFWCYATGIPIGIIIGLTLLISPKIIDKLMLPQNWD